jgi:hypothetical protein
MTFELVLQSGGAGDGPGAGHGGLVGISDEAGLDQVRWMS